jgi:hypothetical protein
MPRYFFHMASDGRRLNDERGRTLDSLSDAHAHAVGLIYKICSHLGAEDNKGWRINIAEADGRVRLAVLFPQRFEVRTWRSYVSPLALQDGLRPKEHA